MSEYNKFNAFILGAFIFIGLAALGYLLGNAAIKFKEYERTVTAKGLSEHEYKADIVIWPIQFNEASNDLTKLYSSIETSTSEIKTFLIKNGIDEKRISVVGWGERHPMASNRTRAGRAANRRVEIIILKDKILE